MHLDVSIGPEGPGFYCADALTQLYGQFTAQPVQRGFDTTIGNSLRHVLLSSIEGAAAITAIRIEGVDHEFSPIPRRSGDA